MAKICFLDNMTALEDADFFVVVVLVRRGWEMEDFDK